VKSIVRSRGGAIRRVSALRAELADANLKLSERKQVERAKGILMKSRGVGEDEAYQMLRTDGDGPRSAWAMIAQQLIDYGGSVDLRQSN